MSHSKVVHMPYNKPHSEVLEPSETTSHYKTLEPEQLEQQEYYDLGQAQDRPEQDLRQAQLLIELGYNMARKSVKWTALRSSRKDDSSMDWQEKYLDKLDRDISEMKNVVQASEDRIARMIENALTEMRDRENQRLSEIRDRDNKRQQEMSEIRSTLDRIQQSVHEEKKWVIGTTLTIAITTVLAIAGMFATILLAIK